MSALLEVRGVTRRFEGLLALDQLDLDVAEGSIHAIIGPNGAGKTTAFNVIAGFLKPTSGRIRFEGNDLTGAPPHQVVRRGIARTFQNIRLFPQMTALENVVTGAHCRLNSRPWQAVIGHGREEREAELMGLSLLDEVDLLSEADTIAGELPYGLQRRLEIARAMASRPRLLLLDEPAAGANPRETKALVSLIRQVRERGTTVALIEHDMSVVMELSDSITVLDHGRKIAEGSAATIRRDAAVIEAYLGDQQSAPRPRATSLISGAGVEALRLESLEVAYGAIAAVKGIDLVMREGEVVTLVGANGAGKTTTLKAIAGLRRPRSGAIYLFGDRIDGSGCEQVVKRGAVLAPEGRQVFGRMSVRENLLMGAFQRTDGQGIVADIAAMYELFPVLGDRREQLAGTLSGGEQQMLAVGRALMARPRILMLDEPSMGLAPIRVQQIFEVIARLRDEGRTILLVEQNATMALSIADRGYVLQTGRVVLEDTAAELLTNTQVREAYLGGPGRDQDAGPESNAASI